MNIVPINKYWVWFVKSSNSTNGIHGSQQKHVDLLFLNGIRGFAALWVLLLHALIESGCQIPGFFHWDGVGLFIVMSGFLMTYHYHARQLIEPWEHPKTWLKFYIRRFLRIAPLYYLLLIVAFWGNGVFAHIDKYVDSVYPNSWLVEAYGSSSNFFDHKYIGPTLINVILHLTFIFGLIPAYATSTPLPDWSIGLEMQFYAVFPCVMLAFKKLNYFWTSIIVIGIGIGSKKLLPLLPITPIGFTESFPLPSFLPLKINVFLIGMLLAFAYCQYFYSPFSKIFLICLAILLASRTDPLIMGVCILTTLILFYDKFTDFWKISSLTRALESFLGNRFATFMADTSYSVYLLHMLIMTPIAALLVKLNFYSSLPGILRFSILVSIVIFLSYSIGWLLYNVVEKNGIRFGKTLFN